eukprot:TRINITY_DN5594_c0_g1_i12.p4 TRINITY_DN5594_c0_g1~~TRINITY_DN5594_c0_g1_i12.p4  ORF type:complete len:103 (+),score=2.42 TRINITY_DN5594_c0_g1_i12:439-747(+)
MRYEGTFEGQFFYSYIDNKIGYCIQSLRSYKSQCALPEYVRKVDGRCMLVGLKQTIVIIVSFQQFNQGQVVFVKCQQGYSRVTSKLLFQQHNEYAQVDWKFR